MARSVDDGLSTAVRTPRPAAATGEHPTGSFRASRFRITPYVRIARPDHWFKNAFMLLGMLLAVFYDSSLLVWEAFPAVILAIVATCMIASSNYVMNEVLDAPYDRMHPTKQLRPVASGQVLPAVAWIEWGSLAALGLVLASLVSLPFLFTAVVFLIAATLYNVPPLRTKDLPYLDVLSESLNNPVRLFLGWFALVPDKVPPLTLTLAYWMAGAFFMATKRFAEYRSIRDRDVLVRYRRSFAWYTEENLLVSMFFYALTCALLTGAFIVRYHVELVLFVPVAAGFLTHYLRLGLKENSSVQNPEKLFRDRGFVTYALLSAAAFVLLMFLHVPSLYELFNINPAPVEPLWTIGGALGSGLNNQPGRTEAERVAPTTAWS